MEFEVGSSNWWKAGTSPGAGRALIIRSATWGLLEGQVHFAFSTSGVSHAQQRPQILSLTPESGGVPVPRSTGARAESTQIEHEREGGRGRARGIWVDWDLGDWVGG